MSIVGQLAAATDLIAGRDRGLERLDTSSDGFYDSFKGLAIVAVMDAIALMLTHNTRLTIGLTETPSASTFVVKALFIAFCAYAASMIALYLICRPPDLAQHVIRAIIAHNWAAPVVSLLFLPPFMLLLFLQAQSHPDPPGTFAALVQMGMIAALILIGIRLLRLSLEISGGRAAAIFAATAAVSLIVELWLSGLLQR